MNTLAEGQIIFTRGDAIKIASPKWLWEGFIPRGTLTIVYGQPKAGKTTCVFSLAATVSKGGYWPDGSKCEEPGDVLIWSGEDSLSHVIVPRLKAAGADMKRIHFIDQVSDYRSPDGIRPFDLQNDVTKIYESTKAYENLKLVIIEPLTLLVPGDMNQNNQVRKALQPLLDLAEHTQASVTCIHHQNKPNAQSRNVMGTMNGSLAFSAVARMILLVVKSDSQIRADFSQAIIRVASNYGENGGAFLFKTSPYELEDLPNEKVKTQQITWGSFVDGSPEEIESNYLPNSGYQNEIRPADKFLLEILKDGPRSQTELEELAAENGISSKQLRSSKERMNIRSEREKKQNGKWIWRLLIEDAQEARLKTWESTASSNFNG